VKRRIILWILLAAAVVYAACDLFMLCGCGSWTRRLPDGSPVLECPVHRVRTRRVAVIRGLPPAPPPDAIGSVQRTRSVTPGEPVSTGCFSSGYYYAYRCPVDNLPYVYKGGVIVPFWR
jgi:hypothetical protein